MLSKFIFIKIKKQQLISKSLKFVCSKMLRNKRRRYELKQPR